jgi:hypothetical protein
MNINNTMANKFQRFLGDMAVGFLAPKGNMADFQHAARLYTDHTFRLAPKNKFLYYVVFNINPDALDDISFEDRHMLELNYLVKTADLPKYTLKTETLNQYNRKTNVYTGIQYDPVTLTMHDDNNGITNKLWALYYGYYIADRMNARDPDSDISPIAYDRNTYNSKNRIPFRYGLDNDSDEPFFNSIQLFTLSRQRFFSYLLCNPKITKWDHDGVDQTSGNGILENKMTIAYDAVIYNSGVVQEDEPAGFAVLHYDHTPSPIAGAEILQNGIAGIFGDDFSLNGFGGGLIGGLVGGLVQGLVGGASPYTNTGNRSPYGYGQPTFLGGGGRSSMSGFQQYGMGGGAVQLAALTVAGVGMAAGAVGNVVSGIGSLFSSSEQTDPARTVEAPNGGDPVAEDAFTAPMPQRRPTEQGSGRGSVMEKPGEREAANNADNPKSPDTDVSDFNKLDSDPSTAESSPGKGKPAPENDMEADYSKYPDTGKPPLMPPSSGEQQQGSYEYQSNEQYAQDVGGFDY